ncbi:carbohydrate ABC transporter permease [Cohnella nanjingensis]|uniref:Carbohydrate ABC transporter permease n=1 Tax=Cohnella nanjingensis TaxID=1387779 RepID=A0A7X0VH07_9BACL|nr:carbohydrate ABC transporter permease [Cohnella nanjingensis]MBB6672983.1 carbohydrate ABC transporter permease [Cohnella nanjingensis]
MRLSGKRASQLALNAFIVLLLAMSIYPMTILLFGFTKDSLTWQYNQWLPALPMWFTNLNYAWKQVGTAFWNTLFVAAAATLGGVFLSSLGGFVFSRMKFYAKEIIFYFIIALMMVPAILGLIPWYLLIKELGLLNSLWALVFTSVFGAPIFGIFLLRGFFSSIPEELFEAAKIDGCGNFKLYYKIAVPVSLSSLATLAIMQVMGVWNDLVGPSIVLTSPDKFVITLALRNFSMSMSGGGMLTNYPALFAAYVISSIPLVLLFFFASKYYIEGLTSSGMKL